MYHQFGITERKKYLIITESIDYFFCRAPMYRQTHQSNTPLGSSPGILQQDLTYAQSDMYRRPTVFVSQAPYQNYNRVVPPPAHNGSNRQVNYR